MDDVPSGETREAQIFVAVLGEFVLLCGSELGTGRGVMDRLARALHHFGGSVSVLVLALALS